MIYKCRCGKKYKVSKEQSKWTYFVKCECGGQAKSPDKPLRGIPLTKA